MTKNFKENVFMWIILLLSIITALSFYVGTVLYLLWALGYVETIGTFFLKILFTIIVIITYPIFMLAITKILHMVIDYCLRGMFPDER